MSFRIPLIPKLGNKNKVQDKKTYKGLPITKEGSIDALKTIGRGTFGIVKLCRRGDQELIIKEMIDTSQSQEELFAKEARIMHGVRHKNVVKFDSIIETSAKNVHSYLMEYVVFDFKHFGQTEQVSNLKDFLQCVDTFNFNNFEHVNEYISRDICCGLSYLHDSGIVHRDLKPENVLISNQHYEDCNMHNFWRTKPIIAKLTDFGESRSELVQTAGLFHTSTQNLYRGTPVYMAPELFLGTVSSCNIENLKTADVWALGMTLFVISNPDIKYPYYTEMTQSTLKNHDCLKKLLEEKKLPQNSNKYIDQQQNEWKKIKKAVEMCAKFSGRPDVKAVLQIFEDTLRDERNIFVDINKFVKENKTVEEECELSSKMTNGFQQKGLQESQNKNCHEVLNDSQETENYSLPSISTATGSSGVIKVDEHGLNKNQESMNVDLSSMQIESCVLADFHQASPSEFNHDAVGAQCSSICLIAAVSSHVQQPRNWTHLYLNDILREGDRIHLETLKTKGWQDQRDEPKLDIDELPQSVNFKLGETLICAQVSILDNIQCALGSKIEELIMAVTNKQKNTAMIIRINDKCRTLFNDSENGTFSVFDPHSCNAIGETDSEGTACLLNFCDYKMFFCYLHGVVSPNSREQIDLAVCNVEVLSTYRDGIDESLTQRHVDLGLSLSSSDHGQDDHRMGSLDRSSVSSIPMSSDATEVHSEEDVVIIIDSGKENETKETWPVFAHRQKGLSVKEILQCCVVGDIPESRICNEIPAPKENSVFVVDLRAVGVGDLPCDDSGQYDTHSSPTAVVELTTCDGKVKSVKTISRKKLSPDDQCFSKTNIYTVRRLYSERNDCRGLGKLTRIISTVFTNKGSPCQFSTIQYLGCTSLSNSSHGNNKNRKRAYVRTRPSVLKREKELLEKEPPKKVICQMDGEIGGPVKIKSTSQVPRDRCQLYNLKKKISNKQKSRNTGPVVRPDFSKLIAELDTGKFVKNVDFSFRTQHGRIFPNTFAMTDTAASWISTFCSPTSTSKVPLGIDMTYKVGPFYTTCLSFPHPYLVHKNNPDINPTIFAGFMTSTGRSEADYRYLANQVKTCGVKKLIYGTDGEMALEKGFETIFPIDSKDDNSNSIKLRCFNHMKEDLLRELKKNLSEDISKRIIDDILGKEFNGIRTPGLVDANKKDFETAYEALSKQWPPSFKAYMESERCRVRSLKSTLFNCMSKDIRMAAGLGNPPHKFDNQRAESINSVLKESIGGQYVDQSAVHGLVYDNVVIPQENEIIKAIIGTGEYRLAWGFQQHELTKNEWKTMTEAQRQRHIDRIFRCKGTLGSKTSCATRMLSVQPEECKEYLTNLPESKIKNLWHEAEMILSSDCINELENGNFCIAGENAAYIVKQNKNSLSCNCSTFKKFNICSHCLVISDQKNTTLDFLMNYKFDPSAAVNQHNSKDAGEKKTKKPRKGAQNVKKIPLERYANIGVDRVNLKEKRPFQFCEIWHNDEEFILNYVNSPHICKRPCMKCVSCGNIISRKNAVPPYDIIFTHRERYMYPKKMENCDSKMVPTHAKLATKFYCLKRDCLLNRHPYFWLGLVNVGAVTLQECHKVLLKKEFDMDA